jgi:hypothetical protein
MVVNVRFESKRTLADARVTSALPLKADIHRAERHVRFVPSAASFNYLVGDGEQIRRNRQTKRLGGLKFDYQLKLGRLMSDRIDGTATAERVAAWVRE